MPQRARPWRTAFILPFVISASPGNRHRVGDGEAEARWGVYVDEKVHTMNQERRGISLGCNDMLCGWGVESWR